MPPFKGSLTDAADRRRRRVRLHRRWQLSLPADFPTEVEAFACDLDRTLIAEDVQLRPRTHAAIARARAAGIPVIVATGRMFRSARPYVLAAGITEPLVCYQGALVADPVSGEFLRHVPMPEAEAHEAIELLSQTGFTVLCYVDDELYVAHETPESEAYAGFQHLEVHEVGDLSDWLTGVPTKLVTVGDPEALNALEVELKAHFGARLYISKSLPHFLEFASPAVTKAAGLSFVAERLGFSSERAVAFGDGENDLELLELGGLRRRGRERRQAAARDRRLGLPARSRGRRRAGARSLPGRARRNSG